MNEIKDINANDNESSQHESIPSEVSLEHPQESLIPENTISQEDMNTPNESQNPPEHNSPEHNSPEHNSVDSNQIEADNISNPPKKQEEKRTQEYSAFLERFDQESNPDVKLQIAIDFMETSLAQKGIPHFKNFWEARKISAELFKENISPAARVLLWARYSDLSKEARRLKEILDEQSGFAAEQIDIAIQALEQDIEKTDALLPTISDPEFGNLPPYFRPKEAWYQEKQKSLDLLNTFASRIHALRKELIKTEMRVRKKNTFFQRLSKAGDKVFPQRKHLIKEVSQEFASDVEAFVQKNFSGQQIERNFLNFRDNIKVLQGMAKVLTLNTQSFNQTRGLLSKGWDQLKEVEKEQRKVRAEQRQAYKKNLDEILDKIQSVSASFNENEINAATAKAKLEEISRQSRRMELGRDEIKILRQSLHSSQQPIEQKMQDQEKARIQQEQDLHQKRREEVKLVREKIDQLLIQSENYDADKIIQERESLIEAIQQLPTSKIEKQDLERFLKPLKDLIAEKKEQEILSFSEADREAFQQLQDLKQILQQRKERQAEIKSQISNLRKTGSASGLDIAQSMQIDEQLAVEEERLDKINQGIAEIQKKISDFGLKKKG